jgi:hypothetical protein
MGFHKYSKEKHMDWITYPTLIWLAIISWFDIRTRQIPHSAWVAIPFLLGLVFRLLYGGWELALLSILTVIASEREFISKFRYLHSLERIILWAPIITLAAINAEKYSLVPTLAILGFWVAWELQVWGGADAMASMTLVLIWPDGDLLVSFFLANLLVALAATGVTLVRERKMRIHELPGLPILLITMIGKIFLARFFQN